MEKQRLGAMYGAMLAANDDPVDPFTSTDAFVYDFLFTQNHKDALGVDDVFTGDAEPEWEGGACAHRIESNPARAAA